MRTPPPYTVSKLLRWRVKVLVSCFYTCNFPLEEESEARRPRENATVMKSKVGTTTSKQKANKKESESSSSRRRRRRRGVGKNKENGSVAGRRTSFSDDDDEDFIVFCFRDDGEVDLVLPEIKNDEAARNEKDSIGKVEEKQAATYTCNEITDQKTREEEEESGEGREVSITASSDSNDHQSDAGSSGSFAFPIVQEKWIGSPVEMPRSSGGVRRPNNTTCIHCCSF